MHHLSEHRVMAAEWYLSSSVSAPCNKYTVQVIWTEVQVLMDMGLALNLGAIPRRSSNRPIYYLCRNGLTNLYRYHFLMQNVFYEIAWTAGVADLLITLMNVRQDVDILSFLQRVLLLSACICNNGPLIVNMLTFAVLNVETSIRCESGVVCAGAGTDNHLITSFNGKSLSCCDSDSHLTGQVGIFSVLLIQTFHLGHCWACS